MALRALLSRYCILRTVPSLFQADVWVTKENAYNRHVCLYICCRNSRSKEKLFCNRLREHFIKRFSKYVLIFYKQILGMKNARLCFKQQVKLYFKLRSQLHVPNSTIAIASLQSNSHLNSNKEPISTHTHRFSQQEKRCLI